MFDTWPFSHKIEIFKYVAAFLDFVGEENFSSNLVLSFDIIRIIDEMIYSGDSEALMIILHIFSLALDDEFNNIQNPVFLKLIEFSKTDEFHSAIQQLYDHEEKEIVEEAQMLEKKILQNSI